MSWFNVKFGRSDKGSLSLNFPVYDFGFVMRMGADSADCLLENSLGFFLSFSFYDNHFLVFCCLYSLCLEVIKGNLTQKFDFSPIITSVFFCESEWVCYLEMTFVIKWKIMTANQSAFFMDTFILFYWFLLHFIISSVTFLKFTFPAGDVRNESLLINKKRISLFLVK